MNEVINQIRIALVALWAIIASALAPTVSALIVLIIFAFVNALIGYQSNMITKGDHFSFRKMWHAVQQLTFYMALVVLLHITFWIFREIAVAEIAVRAICWVGVWGYLVKMLQNFLKIFPKAQGVKLIYYILAVKFIPQILTRLGISMSDEDMNRFYKEDYPKMQDNDTKRTKE